MIVKDAHLICYVCFVDFSEQRIIGLLFCKPIELGCKGIDLFNKIHNFILKTTKIGKSISAYAHSALV